MTARRTAAAVTALGFAPLALAGLAAAPAAAHGSMTDPVSRVAACYAEGPEAPRSAACKAAVAASGPQAFYDWNAVSIADAAGRHKALIPDGKLCSAGNSKYRGLDLARRDWPASRMSAGRHTFRYKGTAPHRGSFALYVTKDGYDPSKPLKWSDLEAKPFARVTDPRMRGGDYVFTGRVPRKSGRHLVYSVWQRSDSPEAFYTCSDVVFAGGGGGGTGGGGGGKQSPAPTPAAPTASAPTDDRIEKDAGKTGGGHGTHGGSTGGTGTTGGTSGGTTGGATGGTAGDTSGGTTGGEAGGAAGRNEPAADGSASPLDRGLAETGGGSATPLIAVSGAGALAVGAAVLFASVRRRAGGGRHGR
ncbi:lytic polysaccharide monooxygenase auxiliary activity family 9 protein [Streptomyces sp. NPDC002073]